METNEIHERWAKLPEPIKQEWAPIIEDIGKLLDRIQCLESHNAKMREALEPLAEQDCESWGCPEADGSFIRPPHDCAPQKAREALTEWEKTKGQ